MRKLAIMMATSACILGFGSIGANAGPMTDTGPSKALPQQNYSLKHEIACQGWGPYCPPGRVITCRWYYGHRHCWCRPCW